MSGNDGPSVETSDQPESIDELFDFEDVIEEPTDIPDAEPQRSRGNWLSTGISALDRYLHGGIPPGRLVSFVAPADTQGELFIKHIVSQHDSLYLTSLRPSWEVEETVRDHLQQTEPGNAGSIDTKVRYLDPDARLARAHESIDYLDNRSIVVIDSVDELEEEPQSEYVDFLHGLKRRLWDSGSVGLLNCFEEDSTSTCRKITFRMSDAVWQLRRSVNSSGVEYLLVVSKFRGGTALTEPVKLELTDEIEIDTSRDIA